MYRPIVPHVLTRFGIKYKEVKNVQKGYRNESYPIILPDRSCLNLLFYKSEPEILARINLADSTAKWAHNHSFPVRIRHDERLMQLSGAKHLSYVGVYNYLPGSTIPWEAYTKKHIKLLGWAMSDLHFRLQSVPSVEPLSTYHVTNNMTHILQKIERYYNDPSVADAMLKKLHLSIEKKNFVYFYKLVTFFDNSNTRQLLHMDMVRGNVLFSKAQLEDVWQIDTIALTGVIDFEKVAFGHPLFDVARTLSFLFVDCSQKPANKIIKYFLNSGYNKRGQNKLILEEVTNGIKNTRLLHDLTTIFLLYDLYKFLRHTPYESLNENHHYLRTREILQARGVIQYMGEK